MLTGAALPSQSESCCVTHRAAIGRSSFLASACRGPAMLAMIAPAGEALRLARPCLEDRLHPHGERPRLLHQGRVCGW